MPDDNTLLRELLAIARTGDPDAIWAQASDNTLLRRLVEAFNDAAQQGIAGSATWGNINGTLSNQTDLQNALNAKLGGSSGTLALSTAGTTEITLPTGRNHYVLDVAVGAGVGVYEAIIDLEVSTDGSIAEILLTYAASTNPTVVIRDGVADTSLIGAGQVGNGSVYTSLVRCFYNGTNWKLLSWS